MKTYDFAISCRADPGRGFEEVADALYEAGCDDALVVERLGTYIVEFDRNAATFARALFSALADIARAGLTPVRVGPDPLVSAAEIAARARVTRQAVSLYVTGQRGRGFPAPVARQDTASPLWQWREVAAWLAGLRTTRIGREDILRARWIARANDVVLPGLAERAHR